MRSMPAVSRLALLGDVGHLISLGAVFYFLYKIRLKRSICYADFLTFFIGDFKFGNSIWLLV